MTLHRLLTESVAQMKGVPASLEVWIKSLLSSSLKIHITSVPSVSRLYLIPDIVQLTTKNSQHSKHVQGRVTRTEDELNYVGISAYFLRVRAGI